MVHLDESTHLYERILDLAPQAVDKIQQMFENKNKNEGSNSNSSNQQSNGQANPDEYNGPKKELDI